MPRIRPSERLPLRKAVWTSKLRMRHFAEAAYWKIRVRESFPSVGESLARFSIWGVFET